VPGQTFFEDCGDFEALSAIGSGGKKSAIIPGTRIDCESRCQIDLAAPLGSVYHSIDPPSTRTAGVIFGFLLGTAMQASSVTTYRRFSGLVFCLLTIGWCAASVGDDRKATVVDKQTAKEVAKLLQERHLSRRPLNDEASERAFDLFIKTLDSAKVYFMQSDIDEFAVNKSQIDDMLIKGDLSFAFSVFDRFLQRVDQRVEMANRMVDEINDLTTDEEMVVDPKDLEYPKTEEEAVDRWRKRIKYNLLVLKSEKDAKAEPKERLKKRFRAFANRMHQFDNEDIVEAFVTSVTMGYDPHTTYFSKSRYENFLIEMRLQLEGIGATLASTDDGLTEIKRIVPGGAADKNGNIKVDDKILAVGQGVEGEMVDVADMKLDDVVHLIRGNAGTVVRLKIMPMDGTEVKTVAITREKIELKDSEAHGVIFESGKKPNGNAYKIGVIDLPSFYSDMDESRAGPNAKSTTKDLKRILGEFKQQQVDAVVLDLSANGGGSLREAIDATGLFIDRGPIVQVKDSFGQIRALNDTASGMAWDGPLVVLTSKFSASASEILAGAIQDYKRGIVVGDSSTHGKGTVQNLIDLNEEVFQVSDPKEILFGAFKVTMQQFYRPQGDSTQKRGVLADVVLPSITDHMDVSESDLDYSLDFDKVPTSRFSQLNLVNNELLEKLRQRSTERRSGSEDFAKRERDINLYVEQKERKTVSLAEEKFFARRKELDPDQEDEKLLERQTNPGEIKRDFFMEEVLNIAVDYIQALGANGVAVK
jgi:carboxyl-terminal processing protease